MTDHLILRMCVGCFTRQNPLLMVRVVRSKDGSVIVAQNETVKGRSVYLCKNALCIKKALDRSGKDALSYNLKVAVPSSVKETVRAYGA